MKKLGTAVVALTFLVVVLVVVRRGSVQALPSAWLRLPDGSSNRIVAVTYGTNHIIGPALGRIIARLPRAVRKKLPVLIHRTTTSQPALVAWIEHRPIPGAAALYSGAAYERLSASDGFISGPQSYPVGCSGALGTEPAAFEAFPRRDPILTVNFFYPSPTGGVTNCGSLQIPNPLHGAYPQWEPEPLPAKKVTSEFEMALLAIRSDNDNVEGELSLSEGWGIKGVETSDATGNRIHNHGMRWSGGRNDIELSYQSGLWPSEKAWKLKFELARRTGFTPDTLLTFKNVPLGAVNSSNAVGWTTNFGGVTLTLASIIRRAPNTNAFDYHQPQLYSSVEFTHSRLPAGTQLDLLSIVYDQGTTNRSEGYGGTDQERNYSVSQMPLDAKTADFTFAVHQSRYVEFTVRPEPPAPATNSADR